MAAVIHGRPAVFQLDIRRRTDFLQHIKNSIPRGKGNAGLGQNHCILWHEGSLFLI